MRSIKQTSAKSSLLIGAANDLQLSILAIILSSPSNKMQLPINTGLAYNAMFGALDERQKAVICQNYRAKMSTGNYHLPIQPDMNQSQPASIELPNGMSNVDGKRWMPEVNDPQPCLTVRITVQEKLVVCFIKCPVSPKCLDGKRNRMSLH